MTAFRTAPMLRNMASDPSAFFRTMPGEWEKLANGVGGGLPRRTEFVDLSA